MKTLNRAQGLTRLTEQVTGESDDYFSLSLFSSFWLVLHDRNGRGTTPEKLNKKKLKSTRKA